MAGGPGRGRPPRLFLVSDGFDVNPEKFYRMALSPRGTGALEKAALETARTAAALGWIVLPLPVGDATCRTCGGSATARPRRCRSAGPSPWAGKKPAIKETARPLSPALWRRGAAELAGRGHRRRGAPPASALAAALTLLRSRFELATRRRGS